MEHDFWQERWNKQELGFHRSEVNPRLVAHAGILPEAPSRVLVPLCGKTIDMTWLEERGHEVVGVELAERAAKDYFKERNLEPNIQEEAPFRRFSQGRVHIHCGDFFASNNGQLGHIDAVYDRASLVALPRDMRTRYAQHVESLLKTGAVYLLLVFEYPQEERDGPPFSIDRAEVDRLFSTGFTIEPLSRDEVEPNLGAATLSSLAISGYKLTRR